MSLYTPHRFVQKDQASIDAVIDAYPFATLISVANDAPFVTHAPVVRQQSHLLTHIACANPHADLLQNDTRVTAIFHGPHDYISSTWYGDPSVPTWNYAVVHITGRVKIIADNARKQAAMDCLIDRFDEPHARQNSRHMTHEERAPLLSAIHVFVIEIEQAQAKFKLSQNKSVADRHRVIGALMAAGKPDSAALAQLMQAELDRGQTA